jgi:hypothetical protein
MSALKKAAEERGLPLPAEVKKRKRGQPLPTGYVVIAATEDVVPPGRLPSCVHLVSNLTRAAMLTDPLAVVPFKGPNGQVMMTLMTEEALLRRRSIAEGLTPERIANLRRAPDQERPNLTLMQSLFDSGLQQCMVSGMPVFNPSEWTAEQQRSIWRVYCAIAAASNSRGDGAAEGVVAALDELRRVISDAESLSENVKQPW